MCTMAGKPTGTPVDVITVSIDADSPDRPTPPAIPSPSITACGSGGEDNERTQLYTEEQKMSHHSKTELFLRVSCQCSPAWHSLPVNVVNAVSDNASKSRLYMCWAPIVFSHEHKQLNILGVLWSRSNAVCEPSGSTSTVSA